MIYMIVNSITEQRLLANKQKLEESVNHKALWCHLELVKAGGISHKDE